MTRLLSRFFFVTAAAFAVGVFAATATPANAAEPAKPAESPPPPSVARQYLATTDFDSLVLVQRRPLNPSHVYTYHQEGISYDGGLFTLDIKTQKLTRLVDATDGIILDCQVSYDGKQILFSWKRTRSTPFEIWRVNTDGSGLTRILADTANNMNACWLPDGGIAFMSDRKPAFAYCWTTSSPVLYRANADGTDILRLSANYLTDFTPSITADGRILYSRWEYVDRPAIPIQSLWSINPDGTGLSGVFGNRALSPATFMEAREIPNGGGKILCVMTAHNGPCRGAIGLLDPAKGDNAQEFIRNLTPDVRVPDINDGIRGNHIRGPYESPFPLDGTHYLVSRDGTILLRDYTGKLSETLLSPKSPTAIAATAAATQRRRAPPLGFYAPQPVRPRALPKTPRRLHFPSADTAPWAEVVMHDVYTGLGTAVKPGEIKRLAIVQEMEKDTRSEVSQRQFGFQFPVVSCGATYAPKRVWGFATVEADGSAHFKAPANIPIYFLPLDAEGRAVQRMRSFTHFMPGEQQSCVGCHDSRNYVSPVIANARRGRTLAAARPAETLTKPEWGTADGFSFPRVVQPVLDKHCVSCHDGKIKNGTATLDLSGDRTDYFNVAYEHLARKGTQAEHGNDARGGMARFGKNPYTSWIPTYNDCESNILDIAPKTWGSPVSRLADIVIAGHPDKHGKQRVALTPAERLRVLMWIDLNVPFYGTSQSLQPNLRGCRKVVPAQLDATLREIAARRKISLPRTFYTRLDNPDKNSFLALPLANGVFKSKDDPDYQRILGCFKTVPAALEKRVDVDFRKVTQATNGCPLLPTP
ncbi:MAG: hypothetical protein LBT53_06195 [Puniceicoccales bacterium]|jgi:hypothetical protein|nr:hypothetical protein [Puniceicoccales bacterium]